MSREPKPSLLWLWILLGVGAAGLVLAGLVVAGALMWTVRLPAGAGAANSAPQAIETRFGTDYEVGEAVVRIESACMDKMLSIDALGERVFPSRERFLVRLRISNSNPNRAMSYIAWEDGAYMTDDVGNRYGPLSAKDKLGLPAIFEGQRRGRVGVYSDKPITDVLVFDRPVPGAASLTLHLPVNNVGGAGEMTFHFGAQK